MKTFNAIILLLVLLIFSCGVKKQSKEISVKKDSSFIQIKNNKKDFELSQEQLSQLERLKSLNLTSNLKMNVLDSTKPARLIEFREGKPYREIITHNAVYTENASVKDSSYITNLNLLKLDYKAFKKRFDSVFYAQKEQKNIIESLERDNRVAAQNFKLLLYVVIAVIVLFVLWRLKLF